MGDTTVGGYLIERLRQLGAGHVFGVPGDFVLKLFDLLAHSDIVVVNTCDEQGAGFAADAYARLRGLGVVCVTYGVGGLKVVNTTAQAYAEESPVIVISGAPGLDERRKHPLLHHRVRTFETQREVFEAITTAWSQLEDPATAPAEIDRVVGAVVRHKLPVYLELPRDVVMARVDRPDGPIDGAPVPSDPVALRAALADASARIDAAHRPVVVAGAELARFDLHDELERLGEALRIPIATTILGKSVIGERHPSYIGVYQGAMGRQDVREYVESADCLILLGSGLTDIEAGIFTARLDVDRAIHATRDRLRVAGQGYENVQLADFVRGLCVTCLRRPEATDRPRPLPRPTSRPDSSARVTVEGLFARLASALRPETIVIAEPGDALFAAIDLPTYRRQAFLSPAYYASLGFAVPAALGAQLAEPGLRPLVLVGDGAFQMTGLELSTIARFGGSPIVVVLDNDGYGTERPMIDGTFNDVLRWAYDRVPGLLGIGRGCVARTFGELDEALEEAARTTETFFIVHVPLARDDASPALRRLTSALASAARGDRD